MGERDQVLELCRHHRRSADLPVLPMTFSSIDHMRRRLCRNRTVRLVWVDPEPHAITG